MLYGGWHWPCLSRCFRTEMKHEGMGDETMLTRTFKIALALLLVLGGISTVDAQEVGIIQAVATVVTSMAVQGTHDLDFGSVTPGVPKTVDKASAGTAGEWHITGASSAEVSVTIDLPAALNHTSAATMPISFNSTSASYDDGTGSQVAPAGVINPNGPSTLDIGAGGELWIWIGGIVTPSISQTGGDYSADITLTVAYTGN